MTYPPHTMRRIFVTGYIMDDIEKLQEVLDQSQNVVFFGGAGVSTESGIPDFRSQDGLYNQKYKYPPEEIISHEFFCSRPEEFYEFYRDRMIYEDARPNAAHLYLARAEAKGKLKAVITQNIDGLHQAAGSKIVYELHGSIHRNYCTRCHRFYPLSYVVSSRGIPRCECGGIIKPDVVLYGEGLDDGVVSGALSAIASADTLIIGGTSLVVYPAAGFVRYFKGKHLIVINKSHTFAEEAAELCIRQPIGEVFAKLRIE